MKALPYLLHGLGWLLVSFLSLVGLLAINLSLAWSTAIPWEKTRETYPLLAGAVPMAMCALGVILVAKRARLRWVAIAALVPATLLAFLGWDATPQPAPDLGPRASKDDPGYLLLMQASRPSPLSRVAAWREAGLPSLEGKIHLPDAMEAWTAWTNENEPIILDAFDQQRPAREWLGRVADQPPLGVFTSRVGEPILDYPIVRDLTQIIAARAFLMAAKGEPDKAVRLLLPPIRAMQHLQRTGCLHLHQLIAAICLKHYHRTAKKILEDFRVGPEATLALRKTLEAAPTMAVVFRNSFGGEAEFAASVIAREELRAPQAEDLAAQGILIASLSRVAEPLLYLPHRTDRLNAMILASAQAVSTEGNLARIDAWEPVGEQGIEQMRNPAGRRHHTMLFVAWKKFVHSAWENESLRRQLLQLTGGLTGTSHDGAPKVAGA